jgi:type VI protein secretion system component Hcp
MDSAQIYMSLVRPSGLPIAGESWDETVKGQIEVSGWKWGLSHDKEEQTDPDGKNKSGDAKPTKSQSVQESIKDVKSTFDKGIERLKKDSAPREIERFDRDLQKAFDGLQRDNERVDQKNKKNDKTNEERQKESEEETEGADKRCTFTFEKRVDVATTQMLNSMKAQDVFPLAILTMIQKSSNNPMTLVIKVEGLRLLEYKLNVSPSDTMTDLMEEWTCDFDGFSYTYQNRRSFGKPQLGSVSDAKQIAAKAATQGTIRTFIMKPRK